jgi:hypothetical protein
MDFSHVFDLGRWRSRFRSDRDVADEAIREGRVPDATPEEVGAAAAPVGFDGKPRRVSDPGNGYGSGTPGGSGWAGYS